MYPPAGGRKIIMSDLDQIRRYALHYCEHCQNASIAIVNADGVRCMTCTKPQHWLTLQEAKQDIHEAKQRFKRLANTLT